MRHQAGPKRQFAINVAANGGVFALNAVLGVWFIPYLIRHLGVAAYGLVPLATSVTSYLSLLTLSLNGAVGRFLTIDLEKKDFVSANRTFNTSLFGSLALMLVLVPAAAGIVLATPHVFDIPEGQVSGTQWLFAATMGAFLVTTVSSSFSISSWARNRFDLRNAVIAVNNLARVGVVVALFSLLSPDLSHVGMGLLAAALLAMAGDVLVWRKLTPQLRVMPSAFDRTRVRQLFGMGGWMVVNQVGTLLFLSIDLIVVNALFGAEAGGKYGAVLVWSVTLRALAGTVSGVLTPTVLAKYARGDVDGMNRISRQSVKFMGLAMALPVGLLCGFAGPFLVLWLGPGFRDQAGLLVVLVIHLSINLAVLPLFGLQVTLNKVRWPGVVTLVMGAANLGLAVALAGWAGWGAIGVAAAGLIVLTTKNALFTPIYGAVIQNLPWWTFTTALLPGTAGALLVLGASYGLTLIWPATSWPQLIAAGAAVAGVYACLAYVGGLNTAEKRLLWSLVPVRA